MKIPTLAKSSYKDFIITCRNKFNNLNQLLEDVKQNKTKVYELIMSNVSKLNTISVNYDVILDINAIMRLQNNDFSNYKKDIATLNKATLETHLCFKRQPLILSYLLLFAQYATRQRTLSQYIEPYSVFSTMPFITYCRLFNNLGNTISKEILKGGYYRFGRIGRITIVKKPVFFGLGTTCNSLHLHWGESYKLHNEIVKKHDIELYNKYINRDIGFEEYRQLAKKYVYDAKQNPNGEKWFMYNVEDERCWWYFYKFLKLRNLIYYSFTPTGDSGIHTRQQRIEDLKLDTVEQVIKEPMLSNVSKINIINKKFKPYTLRYEQLQLSE